MQGIRKVGGPVVLCLILSVWEVASDSYYSSYYGKLLTSDEVAAYTSNGTVANCTNLIATCNSSEPRRIDGSCNNLNHPTKGATRTPQVTLLPKVFNRTSASVFDPRLSESGKPLRLARVIRNKLIADGKFEDDTFTHCITHFSVFFATDITNTKDTTNFVSWRPYCCEEAGKSDKMCAPNLIPEDDYVHRFSNIKCLNMTRPLTFQTSGCLANTTSPTRIVDATPEFDLSPIYGNVEEPVRRTYVNGTLATETVDGRIFPITTGSLLLGINFIPIIFFWRFHNFVASQLLEVNPCWTDNQTFSAAREITIACGCQILYYELMAQLMGSDKLIEDGIIANSTGFRDPYNSSLTPQVASETLIALRYMHKMQESELKFYYSNGTFMNITYPMVNLTANIDFIKKNGNIDHAIQGCFRQASGKADDNVADSDIVNMGLGGLQKSMDIMTNDLAKNRYTGLQSYINYRNYCFGDSITSFDDLIGIIDEETIELLKSVYTHVGDIDLLAGMWVEKIMDDSHVPPTFYCLVSKQLLHNIQSDRHWYERSTRPSAFTEGVSVDEKNQLTYNEQCLKQHALPCYNNFPKICTSVYSCGDCYRLPAPHTPARQKCSEQLEEIRKITVARMLCDVGDSVTEIQPSAFMLPSTCNEIVSCDEIPQIDYSLWADSSCTDYDYDYYEDSK